MSEVAGYTAAQVRAAEAPYLAAGIPLMRRAATALAAVIRERLPDRADSRGSSRRARVLGLIGPGNNGGDALFSVAELAAEDIEVLLLLLDPSRAHADGLAAALAAGATSIELEPTDAFAARVRDVDVVVDGLFGTGSAGRRDVALRGSAREVVALMLAIPASRRPVVVAVDIPSGIDADSGAVPDPVVLPADVTVTFGGVKAGLLLPPASALAGEVRLIDIGIGDELAKVEPAVRAAAPPPRGRRASRASVAPEARTGHGGKTTMTTATAEELAQIGTLVKGAKIGLLTTIDPDGRLLSRPLAAVDTEFDGDLWFFVSDDSHKVDQIDADPQVNVAFESGKGYLSIAGTARLVTDRAKIDEYWTASAEAWFEEGRDDPHVALLQVHADSAEYWASIDPKPIVLLKYAKAAITHTRPDVGENHSIDL